MGKKCCVYGCKTNYDSEKAKQQRKISVFRFPKDASERQRWISVIPNANLKVTDDTVVCELHWPSGYETVLVRKKPRPKHPPSVWPNVPLSQVPTPQPPPRKTMRTSSEVRTEQKDEIDDFIREDKCSFEDLKENLLSHKKSFDIPYVCYLSQCQEYLFIQSCEFSEGVPKFLIKIGCNLKFESYHYGVKCIVKSMSKNKITCIDLWSKFQVLLHDLNLMTQSHHSNIICEQLSSMSPQVVGKPHYSPETIVRSFEYFATSRSLYHRLRIDYKLPSVQTLTRITSKVSKLNENSFLSNVFKSVNDKQKECILIHDEVYVKKMLTYHGGTLFGKAVDNQNELAKTVLGIMISCLYGGPTFLPKMLPIYKLNSTFLHDQVSLTIDNIKSAGGVVKVIICDGNRNNQAFFKKFETESGKPWLSKDGIFLLFDFVHLLKNIRNNWLTEPCGELIYFCDDVQKVAKWSHLVELYEKERNGILSLSDLNEVAVAPKPIERQNVKTCLRVFSDRTYHALLTHKDMKDREDVKETAGFIEKVLSWWKIVNVKSLGKDIRHQDDLEGVINSPSDKKLTILEDFGKMALLMKGKHGRRVKQFTYDTAQAIYHTCFGLSELCRSLLATTHKYVMLGKFTSDPIEKEFSILRQGSGGTYFINVQKVIEKVNIQKAKLLLSLSPENLKFIVSEDDSHNCDRCGFVLDENSVEVFDNLPALESSVSDDVKSAIVYIAGYVTRKEKNTVCAENCDDTSFYFQKYGGYISSLNRGGLNIPTDNVCQWIVFSLILFQSVKNKVCRTSLRNLTMLISEHYDFSMERKHGNVLSNIFINNFCRSETPASSKEAAVKVLKLS